MIDQFANVDDGLGLPNVPVDLSARMREIRARQGLKQSEIARRMGLDPSIPSLWEQGKRPVPASRIPALAEALGVAVTELLEGVSGVAAPAAPSPAPSAPAPRVAAAAEISSPAPPAPVQRTSPDRAPLMSMLAPSALVEDPEPAHAEREIEVAPPVRVWSPAVRPPLNGWIPDGWEPGDRVQDISPALPDGYWLDPVRLERKVAKDTMRSRLCDADRKLIGDKDVPGAAMAERLFQHCSKDAAFNSAKVPLMEGIFRSLLAAEYGGLTADALVETLQPKSSVPITRPLLRKLGVSARTYPFTWVDRELFGR